jgi:hypothetical protein
MPSLTISEEMFERLTKRAAALNVTVEELVTPLLDLAADNDANENSASFDHWRKQFDAWMAQVQTRAHCYPPGFVMDDSRESIYEGCGE